ncbi:unnamed protein product [Coffea canephora]|uniref:DH200=94 genomic scaffold, scaffold_4726 n=1 Tax=Coffea canephora TaxID=49390 RepID=A0A068VL58_COFCA|nr:unnamed protein product [Coffea canephora]
MPPSIAHRQVSLPDFISGLAYNAKKNLLYVADTENHALRVIDFVNDTVRTLAGNGTKGSDYDGGKTGDAQARCEEQFFITCIYRVHRFWSWT